MVAKGPEFKSGFVGIVGRTNVGKSTLINTLTKAKVAITSRKPQTTRQRIRCIVTRGDAQIIFIDTPGFHKPHDLLGRRLNEQVLATIREVDAVLFMVDAEAGVGAGDSFLAAQLKQADTPVVAALNKIDKLGKRQVREQVEAAKALGDFAGFIPISARSGANVDHLVDALTALLPAGPRYYPEGVVSDQPENVVIGELIREKILELTREEVPHSVAIVVDEVAPREDKDLIDVSATVYVERESQKGILIGKGGSVLKEVGTKARRDIELVLGAQVNLKLWVKVERDWRKRAELIDRFGIE